MTEGPTTFGPNSAAVEKLLERAGSLTEAEGREIWRRHLQESARDTQFHAALAAVVDVSHVHGQQAALTRAESAGRDAVTVFAGTSLGLAIAGYVGRLAEAVPSVT